MVVRANKDSFAFIYNEAFQIADDLYSCIGTVMSFLNNASGMIPNTDYEVEHEDIDPEGNPYTYTEKIERWKNEKAIFRTLCNASNGGRCEPLRMAAVKIRKVGDSLEEIEQLLRVFEEDGEQSVSLQELVTSSYLSVELVDGVETVYYDFDGEKLTIAELTNAFYTYSGVAMDSQVQGYLGDSSFATNAVLQKQALDDVQAFVGTAQTARAFGVASMTSIQNVAESLGVNTSLTEATSVLNDKVDTNIQSYITSQASVAGFALIGAYALTSGLFKKEEESEASLNIETKQPASFGNSVQPILGNSSLVGNKDAEVAYQEPIYQQGEMNSSPSEEVLPEIVPITEEKIPAIVSSLEEVDYDTLAIEEFETLDMEQITERTTKVIEEALQLYEAEDKTLLKEKLGKFGYSEPEIEAILENRDYVLTAFIEGDRREHLSEIAMRLADQDGIKDFDTSYDDGQHYTDLMDGTSSDFIVAMGSDAEVTDARNAYFAARDTYEIAIEETNVSIEKAREVELELETLQKEIGVDQSRWNVTQREKYNAVVKKYNDAVFDSQEKISGFEEAKESYTKSKDVYYNAKEDYLKKVKEERIDMRDEESLKETSSVKKEENNLPKQTDDTEVLSLDNEDLLKNLAIQDQSSLEFLE